MSTKHIETSQRHVTDRPLADKGLISYRYVRPHSYIMIGATDQWDALREANRSLSAGSAMRERLQVWNGSEYVPVVWES